jgi:hypothetical protein
MHIFRDSIGFPRTLTFRHGFFRNRSRRDAFCFECERRQPMLKKLMLGAVLAALVGSSAIAQSYDPETGSGNVVPNTGGEGSGVAGLSNNAPPSEAYPYEHPAIRHQQHKYQESD